MDSLDDLFQPSTTSARPVGRFKPKSKSKPASVSLTVRPCTSATAPPTESPTCIEGHGGQQKGPETGGVEGSTISLGLESFDRVLPPITTATSAVEPKANAVFEYDKCIASSVISESTNSLSSPHNVPLDGSNTGVLPPIDSSLSDSSAHQRTDNYFEVPPAQDLENGDIPMDHRSLGMEEHVVFSCLEALNDSVSLPTLAAVQGVDESHPEPVVQPNNTDSNTVLSLGTDVMQSVSPLVGTESHSSQIERAEEIPSGASTEAFSINSQNSALVKLSPQLLTNQETVNPTVVLHAETISGDDGFLQRDHQSSREEVATASASLESDVAVDTESLVDILLQPAIATGQSARKFLRKPFDLCKSKKIASPSVISEAAGSVSSQIEGLEGSTPVVQDSASAEPSISMPCMSTQTGSSPHPETGANGNFQTDVGGSARGEAETSPGLDSINDILLEPATVTSRGVGKFRPKSKIQISTVKPFVPGIPSDDVEPISSPQKAQFLPGNECLKEASTGVFVYSVTIDSTSKHHYSQPGSQEAEDHFGLASLEAEIAGGEEDLQNVPETSRIEDAKSSSIQDEAPIFTAVKENESGPPKRQRNNKAINTSIDQGKGVQDELHVSAAEEVEAGPTRRLRKRTKCTPVDKIEDGNYEPSVMEEHCESDNDGRGEDKPKKKRVPKAAKKSVGESDKPVKRQCKKASEEPDTVTNKPAKKKFSHTTQRSRRRVSKVLLETPEEEIDPRKLTMKDLIMLAEFRERQSSKEAAAAKKCFPTSSADNSLRNDSPYDNDDPLASEGGFEQDDDQANHRDEQPSSKLNYHSFMKRTPKERWSKSDTEMFYEALRQFGTDFAMIQQLFPGRTRHQVKLKFKAEERKHPLQLSDALVRRSKDHSHFELLIERLRSQAEQNSTRDEESLDLSGGNEEDAVGSEQNGEEVKKNEQNWEEMKKDSEDEIQKEKQNDLEREVESPVKSCESPYDYDWSQYRSADAFSPQDMGKDYYSVL